MENEYDEKTIKYLQLLAQKYPSIQSVASEIINLRAIMNLPKGTEHYQSVTGIAGYTLVYNSHQMYLSEHEPFTTAEETVRTNSDMESRVIPFKTFQERIKIADTDDGKEIAETIADLQKLLDAYRDGTVKQGIFS